MTPEPIKILILEDDPGGAPPAREVLDEAAAGAVRVSQAARVSEALRLLEVERFDAIVLDLSLPESQGLATFDLVRAHAQDLPVVLLTGAGDEATALEAVRRGAHDYLVRGSMTGDALLRATRSAIERHRLQAELLRQTEHKAGRVVGFVGAKGGVGTTTVVLNVATALALRRTGEAPAATVIAAELRPYLGAFSLQVGPPTSGNLGHLLGLHPDSIHKRQLVARLTPTLSGPWLLHGPQGLGESRDIETVQSEAVVRGLAGMADHVILDLPCYPSPATQAAARNCHMIVLVVEPEPGCVAAGRVMADVLGAWGIEGSLLRALVVDRSGWIPPMETAAIASQLGCQVLGTVPLAADAMLAASREEVPLVAHAPGHLAARALIEIADRLAGEDATAHP